MQLHYSPASPYARKVRILLRSFHLLEQTKEIETSPLDNEARLLDLNPLGKIPCLITAEGLTLFDSQVICRYLDETYNDGKLHPNGAERWSDERDLSLIQGILDEAVFVTLEKRREKALQSDFWRERYQAAILRSLESIAPRINKRTELDMVGISMICALDYLSFRHQDLQWETKLLELAGWTQRWRSVAELVQTSPLS